VEAFTHANSNSGICSVGIQNFRLRISYLEEFHTVVSQKQLSVQTAAGLKIFKPDKEIHLSCCIDTRRKITYYKLNKVRCKYGEAYRVIWFLR
jgi:hypothetical protein